MDKKKPSSHNNTNRDLLRYAGMGTQLLVSIGLAFFIGYKADNWLNTSPVFACVLPLMILTAIFYKLIRETGNKNKDEPR